jgi:hypothetical protein
MHTLLRLSLARYYRRQRVRDGAKKQIRIKNKIEGVLRLRKAEGSEGDSAMNYHSRPAEEPFRYYNCECEVSAIKGMKK